jgi:PTH1 family peptidyl-tRNA hydrolase
MVPSQWDVADYVLSRFKADEQDEMKKAISNAANGLIDWVRNGIDYCMNRYNGN